MKVALILTTLVATYACSTEIIFDDSDDFLSSSSSDSSDTPAVIITKKNVGDAGAPRRRLTKFQKQVAGAALAGGAIAATGYLFTDNGSKKAKKGVQSARQGFTKAQNGANNAWNAGVANTRNAWTKGSRFLGRTSQRAADSVANAQEQYQSGELQAQCQNAASEAVKRAKNLVGGKSSLCACSNCACQSCTCDHSNNAKNDQSLDSASTVVSPKEEVLVVPVEEIAVTAQAAAEAKEKAKDCCCAGANLSLEESKSLGRFRCATGCACNMSGVGKMDACSCGPSCQCNME